MNLFEKLILGNVITEAPEDEGPPLDDSPPDLDMDVSDDFAVDSAAGPPDLDMGPGESIGGGDDSGDSAGFDDGGVDNEESDEPKGLSDKVSTILNQKLHRKMSALLNDIGSQLSSIKDNSDMLLSISIGSQSMIDELSLLEENIRLYMTNIFLQRSYEINMEFYNKSVNMLKLLNDKFNMDIDNGIRDNM